MAAAARKFEDSPARRERTPLLVGLMGVSGSGKTFSALRIAKGIQQVTGGEIFYIDTEAGRAKHYADTFTFRHVPFAPPFGPLDYLAALEHCHKKGASVIVVDSMSHEHEGPGGILEMHDAEHQRLGGGEGTKMLAWSKPKQQRRRLINTLLQMQTNFVFCFRAKEKIKMVPTAGRDGKTRNEPVAQGFMPIGGDEYVYEMTVNCLLYPSSNGIPTWQSEWIGERMMTKLPAQFKGLFAKPVPLSEDIGKSLAEWASGTKTSEFEVVAGRIANAQNVAELEALVGELQEMSKLKKVPPAEYRALRAAYAERHKTLTEFAATETYDGPPDDEAPAKTEPEALVQEEPGADG